MYPAQHFTCSCFSEFCQVLEEYSFCAVPEKSVCMFGKLHRGNMMNILISPWFPLCALLLARLCYSDPFLPMQDTLCYSSCLVCWVCFIHLWFFCLMLRLLIEKVGQLKRSIQGAGRVFSGVCKAGRFCTEKFLPARLETCLQLSAQSGSMVCSSHLCAAFPKMPV